MALDGTLTRLFALNLRAIRRQKSLTQAQVAERLGVTQATYSRYEAGENSPTLTTVQAVAVALGVSHEELLSSKKLEAVA